MHQQTRQAFPNHSLTRCVQSEEHNLVQSSQIIFQGFSSPRKKLNFSVKLSRRRRLFISRLNSVTRKKSPNFYKCCPKMISQEKWMTLTHLQKLPKNVRDLDRLIVSKGFKNLPKVQKIAQSGHTAFECPFCLFLSLKNLSAGFSYILILSVFLSLFYLSSFSLLLFSLSLHYLTFLQHTYLHVSLS